MDVLSHIYPLIDNKTFNFLFLIVFKGKFHSVRSYNKELKGINKFYNVYREKFEYYMYLLYRNYILP